MKKRLFAGLLTAVLLVSLLPLSAFASEDEQNSGLTAAEQTETTQAAEMPEAELDIQNVPAETTSSESSSVDVTDFSFYAVRTWQSKGYYNQRSESRIQLTEKDDEYILYVPVNGINNSGKQWDLRVQAPQGYTDTFYLYYITYRDLSIKDEGTSAKSDVGYSVNASSETYTTENGETVQSVQTDLIHTAANNYFKWSDTMTLTWTKDGEEQNCKLHIVPYCDLEEPTHLTVSTMNGNNMEGCPLAQVDENTYRTRTVQGRTTNIYLRLTMERLKATINGTEYEKGAGFPVDTSEIGTKTYTLVVSDTGEQAETRSYDIVIDTISEEDDFTPRLDTTKTTNGGKRSLYTIRTADQAELKMVLDETQAQKVQAAGGTTTYSWQVGGLEVSTSDSYTIETKYKFSMVQVKCFITNTVDGAEWTKQFSINVKNSVPGAIDYTPTVIVTNTGTEEYTVGHPAGKLEATVVRDANTPGGSLLRYQWYSKAEGATKWTAISKDGTASVYYPLTNEVGTTSYCCVARVFYTNAKVPTTVPEDACATITVKAREWAKETGITGSGTQDDPYTLSCLAGFEAVRDEVNAGISLKGVYFKMTADVTLPADWEPIGGIKDPNYVGTLMNRADMGRQMNPFSATLDGDGHTLTIAKGGKPLLKYTRDAVIKNLNIQGERIEGNGLLQYYTVDYGEDGLYNTGVPDTITIENCHIIGKTNITQSGFLGGYASGANRIVISNCSVGRDVVIGCDKDQDRIGSLAGDFNGTIVNCTSAATVYGVNRVGGLVGAKGQSMGLCDVMSSSFTGKVIATGNYVGGIMGVGYVANSAPNSPWALVQGCFVSGSVEGKDYVGGITGGEPGVLQCWGNGAGVICDNVFYGTLSATGKNVGAIAGKIRSLNKYTEVDNNYYLADCGAEKGIGAIDLVDTTCKDYPAVEDGRYICSREGYEEPHFMAGDFSREDDPLGADADKLAKAVTAKELTDGTVVAWLNGSDHSYHNWIQGENGPVISDKPVAYALAVSGDYKTIYTIGDELDLTGLVLTATWTDGSTTEVDLADVEITGFDTNQRGEQTVTLAYGAAKVTTTVTVLLPAGKDITVSFALLGDSAHGDSGDKHTLADNNLETWIDTTKVTVSNNATVLDVILAVVGDRFDIKNESGNYIQAITPKDGTELAEFTNGKLSGWMYTLNGVHPNLGVAQQYLNEGDVIVFHYTDDYLKEYEAEQNRTKTAEEVIAMIDGIGTVDLSKAGAINAARSAYDKLTDAEKALVTNYNVLVAAEAAYAKLVAEMGKKLDEIYKTTGDFMGTLGTPTVNSTGGEWMVIGLARSGRPVPAGYYDNVVEYVKAKADANERLHPAKVTDNARVILALTAIGKDVTNVGGHNLLKGLDNMDYVQTQGINGPIWALIALDSHNYPTMGDVTREKLIQVILDAQLSNGGWNLSGNDADPDMTAMAIQSLAPYYKENEAVKAAVDKALDVLSELQLATGGFGSWGTENSESCAQVIVALTALGIDPAKDSRFIKNGLTILDALASYYVDGGGFRHIASGDRDGMATEQGYYALAAYYRFINGQTRLYDMSDVTIKANDQPVQPTDPTTPVTPATGDNQPVMLWFGSVLISGAAILLLAQKKKKVR